MKLTTKGIKGILLLPIIISTIWGSNWKSTIIAGIGASYTYDNVYASNEFKSHFQPSGLAGFSLKFGKNIYVKPYALANYLKGKHTHSAELIYSTPDSILSLKDTITTNIVYLGLPIAFGYSPTNKLSFEIGPVLNFMILKHYKSRTSSKFNFEPNYKYNEVSFSDPNWDFINFGLYTTCAYRISPNFSIRNSFYTNINSIFKADSWTSRPFNITIGLGYDIGKSQ